MLDKLTDQNIKDKFKNYPTNQHFIKLFLQYWTKSKQLVANKDYKMNFKKIEQILPDSTIIEHPFFVHTCFYDLDVNLNYINSETNANEMEIFKEILKTISEPGSDFTTSG
jgi:hypothetical protein